MSAAPAPDIIPVNRLTALRASSAPAAFTCPASVWPGDIEIDGINEAAAEGTGAHDLMRTVAERDLSSIDELDITGVAQKYGASNGGLDVESLRMAAINGLWMWKRIRGAYIGGAGEIDLEDVIAGVRVTGHVDLFTRVGDIAHGADWKFGRLDHNYYHQVATYMVLILRKYPELEEVLFSICWMRDKEIETYRMTRAGAQAWEAAFEAEVVNWNGRIYRPGGQCAHCKRSTDCPALIQEARRNVAILADSPVMAEIIKNGLQDIGPAEIINLFRWSKALVKFAESFQESVKQLVERSGPIVDGNSELRFVETAGSRVIDPLKAWPVLEDFMSAEEIAQCITVRPSKVDDVVAEKANEKAGKKGKGAEAKRRIAAALDAVGAVTRTPGRYFRDQRPKD